MKSTSSQTGTPDQQFLYRDPAATPAQRVRSMRNDDRLDCFLGSTKLLTLRRGRPPLGSAKHGHVVDFRRRRRNHEAALSAFAGFL